jgi:hypothetical protein
MAMLNNQMVYMTVCQLVQNFCQLFLANGHIILYYTISYFNYIYYIILYDIIRFLKLEYENPCIEYG